MKKKTVALLMALVLVFGVAVGGTIAYLTSNDAVVNTFTVGSVAITLDELDVDNSTEGENDRDQANAYHLLPGHEYVKDPIVHVDAESEDCWVFVKVENGIAAYEAATTTGENAYTNIEGQIAANGWTPLEGVANVYYKLYTQESDRELEVFQEFKIADNAQDVSGWSSINAENTKINVTAYAVQKDGFDTANAAWTATFGA